MTCKICDVETGSVVTIVAANWHCEFCGHIREGSVETGAIHDGLFLRDGGWYHWFALQRLVVCPQCGAKGNSATIPCDGTASVEEPHGTRDELAHRH